MRTCEQCKQADRAVLEFDGSCKGKCSPLATDDPETHSDECPRVIHEVRRFYVRVKREDVLFDAGLPDGKLRQKYVAEGWKLKRDGHDLFRWRMLCRHCIERESERAMVQRDYKKGCEKARGEDNRSYGQFMLEQELE